MAINGFTTCSPASMGVFKVPGTARSLQVRREIAPLLIGFAAEFHAKVEPITNRPPDDWGYNCRRVRGRATVSFHAAGLAIDLNATRHPLGKRGTFTRRQAATIRALAAKYGLRWGGDYRGRADEMHFEVIRPRPEALALVNRLQSKPAASRSLVRKAVPPRLSKLRYGARNSDIVKLQLRLRQHGYGIAADGAYGPATKSAVRGFQRRQGWGGAQADGLMGPVTLDRLF